MTKPSIYNFSVKDTKGEITSISKYKGKVLLIVNTASKCGFTPQLDGLESLRQAYMDQGFEILAFPSNDFAGQEPLEGPAIEQFCMTNYSATYPIYDKIHVKGSEAHELFKFLSEKKLNGAINSKPKWNFHKYLINKEGQVVDYFYSFTSPTSKKVKKAVEHWLTN